MQFTHSQSCSVIFIFKLHSLKHLFVRNKYSISWKNSEISNASMATCWEDMSYLAWTVLPEHLNGKPWHIVHTSVSAVERATLGRNANHVTYTTDSQSFDKQYTRTPFLKDFRAFLSFGKLIKNVCLIHQGHITWQHYETICTPFESTKLEALHELIAPAKGGYLGHCGQV